MKSMLRPLKVTVAISLIATVLVSPAFFFAASGSVNAQSAATPAPIVGFWYIKQTAEGNVLGPPNGTVIDWGLQQFHSDGTEILNSGSGPKRFCLGVWVKGAGPSNYEVNHFPIDYPDATTLHILNLRERITLSQDHNSMTGTFTFDIYDSAGSLLQHIAGDLQGHRITMGSSVQDILPPTP